MCINMGVRTFGPFKCPKPENRGVHILSFLKRRNIIYLARLKEGTIRHAYPHYVICRELYVQSLISFCL